MRRSSPPHLALLALLVLAGSPAARAVTLRYALIVGNNQGQDTIGATALPPLRHAEREARRLRGRLIELCRFDPSPARTVLLLDASRREVLAAARALARLAREDRAAYGEVDVLFAFFYTGHGLAGRLLLRDGPLTSVELGQVLRSVPADFTVGVFDACFSGSLDLDTLRTKGIRATPGLNLFRQLPQEVLSAEGSVWYVSSGPDQLSYEDETLGGVFTHFFIEGLDAAEAVGPAIPLGRIWDYAARQTETYTAARGRRQIPQQRVARLAATGPLYFSFPTRRSARLVLAPSVHGRFLLAYADGSYTEVIYKEPGRRRELPVFPGPARLMLLEAGEVLGQSDLALESGGTVVLRRSPDPLPEVGVGEAQRDLWIKGFGEQQLTATALEPTLSVLTGAAYQMSLTRRGVLAPLYTISLLVQLDHAGLTGSLLVGYGADQQRFGSWSYDLHALAVEARLGYGGNLGPVRVTALASLGLGPLWQTYDDGTERADWYLQPGALVSFLYPGDGPVAGQLFLRGGAVRAPGAGVRSGHLWEGWLGGGIGLVYRVR